MKIEELIKVKKLIRKKKPIFRRSEGHRSKRLPDNWRKPKGHHSKIRRHKRWAPKMPCIGRRTPAVLRNTDRKGRKLIKINSVNDLKLLGKDSAGIVSKKLSLRSREKIALAAKNYTFINFNPEKILKQVVELKERAKNKKMKKKQERKPEEKTEKPSKTAEKPLKPAKKPEKPKPLVNEVEGGKE